MSAPILIVGGGPAGLSTARAYRAAGGAAPVTLLTDEPHLPYQRPPLTKEYLRTGEGRDELPLEDAPWFAAHGVTLRHGQGAALDPEARRLTLAGGETLAFSRCVLATGSAPVRPPLPGVDLDGVQVLRTIADADALRGRVADGADRVLVVGSGFIGCEAAVSLRALGCAVTMISAEPAPQTIRLGEQASARIAGWLEEAGVELVCGTRVEAIRRAGDGGLEVERDDDRPPLSADVVVLGAGARARTELAEAAGLLLDEEGTGVVCDAELCTSHPAVLAVGDLARVEHARAGRSLRVEHWGDALAHGEAAGRLLAGHPAAWTTVPGFWSMIGERTLKLKAWGDGWETEHLVEHPGGGFTVSYGRDGVCVGVLTHEADGDHEGAEDRVGEGRPVPGA